jgi:thioredoxin 1
MARASKMATCADDAAAARYWPTFRVHAPHPESAASFGRAPGGPATPIDSGASKHYKKAFERRESMSAANVLEINDLNFDTEVLKSSVPFLLDFSAVWCGPCKVLSPIVDKLADELQGKVRVGKLDIDDSPGVATKFGIRGVPTVLVFKSGQEAGRHVGVTNKETLIKLLGV